MRALYFRILVVFGCSEAEFRGPGTFVCQICAHTLQFIRPGAALAPPDGNLTGGAMEIRHSEEGEYQLEKAKHARDRSATEGSEPFQKKMTLAVEG